jgi:hypothetical protein
VLAPSRFAGRRGHRGSQAQAKIHLQNAFGGAQCQLQTSVRVTRRRVTMNKVMSACGVICSDCPAYVAASRGLDYQKEAAEAWSRIYGFQTQPEKMSCGGCLSSDDQVFHTSVRCTARRCCLSKSLNSCAECPEESCELLARAQSNWDTVPEIGAKLSASDFEKYAQPYCGYRERFKAARRAFRSRADVR